MFEIPQPYNALYVLISNLPRPLILVHPFCGMAWREWNRFGDLLEELSKLNCAVVVVGKKENYATSTKVYDFVNRLSIAELFWVTSQADIFVTADSGPMHIAFALEIPTVALFGPVRPDLRVRPRSIAKHKILYKPTVESEEVRRITQRKKLDNEAMQSISVEEVLAAIKMMLNKTYFYDQHCIITTKTFCKKGIEE